MSNLKSSSIEYGDYNVKVSEDGTVIVFKNDGIDIKQVDVLEEFALMMLTNTLSLDKVISILESGWGKLGSIEENQKPELGFFGPTSN